MPQCGLTIVSIQCAPAASSSRETHVFPSCHGSNFETDLIAEGYKMLTSTITSALGPKERDRR